MGRMRRTEAPPLAGDAGYSRGKSRAGADRGSARPRTDSPQNVGVPLARISADLSAILRTSEVHTALAYLNARTRFRFTGIYRVDPPMLRNVHLFDRENPALNISGKACPLDDTYCSITAGTDSPFATSEAGVDPRLVLHAARDSVISYAGVPIRMTDGRVWGTLCHFDVRPRLIPAAEVPVLESVVAVFAAWIRESREKL